MGEYLALTGQMIGAGDAIACRLADGYLPAHQQTQLWADLTKGSFADSAAVQSYVASQLIAAPDCQISARAEIDQYFSLPTVPAIMAALEAASSAFGQTTAQTLRKRSPLMLHVVLAQIRHARQLSLAEDLRMERNLVRHCFYLRSNRQSETLEGIRALAVDKDHNPRWSPARIEDVDTHEVAQMFASPWPAHAHPLAALVD